MSFLFIILIVFNNANVFIIILVDGAAMEKMKEIEGASFCYQDRDFKQTNRDDN